MSSPRACSLVLALAAAAVACKKSEAPAPAPSPAAAPATAVDDPWTNQGPKAAAQAPITAPFLWTVEKDGKTSTLFGTMHLGVDTSHLPPVVWQRFDAAKSFAMETDITDPKLLSAASRSDGKTLEDELGPEHWKKLTDLLGSTLAGGLKGMKASTAASMVALQGLPMTAAMDLTFQSKAKAAGKRLVYLEEATAQLAILDKWLDAKALRSMLDNIELTRTSNQQLLAAYRAGDDKVILDLANDRSTWKAMGMTEASFAQAMDELLYRRNTSWIPTLETMLAQGDAFVAVGAMHLVGPRSVIDLLTARGYKVTRITG